MTNHKIRLIWAFVQQDLRINKGKKNLDCRSNLKDTFTKEIYFAQLLFNGFKWSIYNVCMQY